MRAFQSFLKEIFGGPLEVKSRTFLKKIEYASVIDCNVGIMMGTENLGGLYL